MSLAPGDARHGTAGGYTNWQCRCGRCREAWKLAYREYRARRRSNLDRLQVHGTEASYLNWGCRCSDCRAAAAVAEKARYARRRGDTYKPLSTPDERARRREQVAALHALGSTDTQIAERLGVGRSTVIADRRILGITTRRGLRPTEPAS